MRSKEHVVSKKTVGKPVVSLPQTAQRLVDAARDVVLTKGYAGLTLDAVQAGAGLNKSLVRYYFGSKAGLIEALIDTLFPAHADLDDALARASSGEEKVRTLLAMQRNVAADDDVNRLFFELFPHVLRDRRLRLRFVDAYRESRLMDKGCMEEAAPAIDPPQAERLAALTVAMLEGLAVQRVIDPKGLDFAGAYEDWERMLTAYLGKLASE